MNKYKAEIYKSGKEYRMRIRSRRNGKIVFAHTEGYKTIGAMIKNTLAIGEFLYCELDVEKLVADYKKKKK